MANSSQSTCTTCEIPATNEYPPNDATEVQLPVSSGSEATTQIQVQAEDVLDPSTFSPPTPLPTPRIVIEFCDRCRWLHRATWTQTELFLTFPPPIVQSISLVPRNSPETAGRFRVWLLAEETAVGEGGKSELLWDRKTQGGFPELKDLKQRVRDRVQPNLALGHSDKKAVPS